jgi:hypothetical protein
MNKESCCAIRSYCIFDCGIKYHPAEVHKQTWPIYLQPPIGCVVSVTCLRKSTKLTLVHMLQTNSIEFGQLGCGWKSQSLILATYRNVVINVRVLTDH